MKAITQLPSVWDVIDMATIATASYFFYQINFNLFFTGYLASTLALMTGAFDWVLRKKDPYIVKIILAIVPSVVAIYLGFTLQ